MVKIPLDEISNGWYFFMNHVGNLGQNVASAYARDVFYFADMLKDVASQSYSLDSTSYLREMGFVVVFLSLAWLEFSMTASKSCFQDVEETFFTQRTERNHNFLLRK